MQTNENKKDENLTEDTIDRAYELGYLLLPSISEDKVLEYVSSLKNKIIEAKGEIVDEENPELIDLAYQMEKTFENKRSHYDSAYFGWFNFILDASSLAIFKKFLDGEMNVIRFLIVKIDKKTAGKAENPVRKSMSFKKTLKNKAQNDEVKDSNEEGNSSEEIDNNTENEVESDAVIDEKIDELAVSA